MKALKVFLIILILISLTSCGFFFSAFDSSEQSMREMKELIPEMVEIFEQSQDRLETLRNGNFANLGTGVGSTSILYISYGVHGGIPYEEWSQVEWLTDEEREDLLFLFTGKELSRNFTQVNSGTTDGSLVAVIYQRGSGRYSDNIIYKF